VCWHRHSRFLRRLRTLDTESAAFPFQIFPQVLGVPPLKTRTMAKSGNVVHQYFKRDFEGYKLLVKLNPIRLTGVELTRFDDGRVEKRELEFDEDMLEDLKTDGFDETSALEFNLYRSGLA